MHVLGSRPSPMARIVRLTTCVGAVAAILAATACEDRTRTKGVREDFAVVPGTPQVESGAPEVKFDPERHTDDFRINTLRQCDLFQQLSVRKVDILWVVDSSGSMAAKQAKLAASFQGFMNQLVSANPPIDFRIAVANTDTDNPQTRGKLRLWTIGATAGNYLACSPQAAGGTTCNAGDGTTAQAVQAFGQMVQVGTSGSAVERGLLQTYLVLESKENHQSPGAPGFLRQEAALYVVVVSDEDDASCNPMVQQPPCTADPGCRCAPDATLGGISAYGSTPYFIRYLETFKGFGREDLVGLAAIVALDDQTLVPSQFGEPSAHVGCCRRAGGADCPSSGSNDGTMEIAYHGDRYIKVAAETGGVAINICEDDFSGALSALGYAASGLRREFRLSRGPDLKLAGQLASGLELFVSAAASANCSVDGNCPSGQVCRSGRCALKLPVNTQSGADQAQYIRCEASAFRNVVRFHGSAVPESLATVEVCYDVAPDFSTTCQ